MVKKNTILSPVVKNLVSQANPLGKEINLKWRQSHENGFWILRRPWRWPSGRELPLLEVGKTAFLEALFPSPYAILDGFASGSKLKKVEMFQLLEREFPRKGMLFVLEHYPGEIKLSSFRLTKSIDSFQIMDAPKLSIRVQESRVSANSRLIQFFMPQDREKLLVKIFDHFTEEGERVFQVSLLTEEVLHFKKMQILSLVRDEDELVGQLSDVGLQGETDYYYTLVPKSGHLFHKVQTHRRAFSSYGMESKVYKLLPSHYVNQDNHGQLERFMEVVGSSLNEIRGMAEELRDLQDMDRCRLEMLPLLARWIGWDFPRSELPQLRQDLKEALALYRKKGTKKGLRQLIQKLTGKKCEKIVEYRHQMFFTNDPLNRTNDKKSGYQYKTCFHPPSTISIEFSPFEEWKGSVGLEKKHLKKLIEKFLPAHVKLGEVAYTILPLREKYQGVEEVVHTVLQGPAEKVLSGKNNVREKIATSLELHGKPLELLRTNDQKAKTNDSFYRTYHPLIQKGK